MREAQPAIRCVTWMTTGPSAIPAVERGWAISMLSPEKNTSARCCSSSDSPIVTAIWLISGTLSAKRTTVP